MFTVELARLERGWTSPSPSKLGTFLVTGPVVVESQNGGGAVVERWSDDFSDLLRGNYHRLVHDWDSTGPGPDIDRMLGDGR